MQRAMTRGREAVCDGSMTVLAPKPSKHLLWRDPLWCNAKHMHAARCTPLMAVMLEEPALRDEACRDCIRWYVPC
jgi:hypothetical protein